MKNRLVFGLVGMLLALAGVFLPTQWYAPLPAGEGLPAPAVSGATLFRLCLVVEGVCVAMLGLWGWQWRRLDTRNRIRIQTGTLSGGEAGPGAGFSLAVAVLTLVALGLRLYRADLDLWLDEIVTLVESTSATVSQVWISYTGSNNHLLNSLLVKTSVALFGESELTTRLPAILFGTLSVPALYWMPGSAIPRRVRLGAAALLAVSYHHVFFSQNARGYSPYLLFSILSTGFYLRALSADRGRDWALWVICTLLGFAALLLSAFVFLAQAIVGSVAVLRARRAAQPVGPLLVRLLTVFTLAGLLVFQLYSVVLPQVWVYVHHVYADPAVGSGALSAGFIKSVVQGLGAGGSGSVLLLAAPLAFAVGVWGLVVMFRRSWALALLVTLPMFVQLATVMVRGLSAQPRMFLLALPFGLLVGVLGLDAVLRRTCDRYKLPGATAPRLLAVIVVLTCFASAWTLRRYYAHPKQPYRAAVAFVASERGPDDDVLVISVASTGMRYYGQQAGWEAGRDYKLVRTIVDFDRAVDALPDGRGLLVTTLYTILEISEPQVAARIDRNWKPVAEFAGTLGGGGITVWRRVSQGE